jgi:hypothetical protein
MAVAGSVCAVGVTLTLLGGWATPEQSRFDEITLLILAGSLVGGLVLAAPLAVAGRRNWSGYSLSALWTVAVMTTTVLSGASLRPTNDNVYRPHISGLILGATLGFLVADRMFRLWYPEPEDGWRTLVSRVVSLVGVSYGVFWTGIGIVVFDRFNDWLRRVANGWEEIILVLVLCWSVVFCFAAGASLAGRSRPALQIASICLAAPGLVAFYPEEFWRMLNKSLSSDDFMLSLMLFAAPLPMAGVAIGAVGLRWLVKRQSDQRKIELAPHE